MSPSALAARVSAANASSAAPSRAEELGHGDRGARALGPVELLERRAERAIEAHRRVRSVVAVLLQLAERGPDQRDGYRVGRRVERDKKEVDARASGVLSVTGDLGGAAEPRRPSVRGARVGDADERAHGVPVIGRALG